MSTCRFSFSARGDDGAIGEAWFCSVTTSELGLLITLEYSWALPSDSVDCFINLLCHSFGKSDECAWCKDILRSASSASWYRGVPLFPETNPRYPGYIRVIWKKCESPSIMSKCMVVAITKRMCKNFNQPAVDRASSSLYHISHKICPSLSISIIITHKLIFHLYFLWSLIDEVTDRSYLVRTSSILTRHWKSIELLNCVTERSWSLNLY